VNVVCVPFRPDTPERIANWKRTREQWAGWKIFKADSDGEFFARAQACNRAAVSAGKWKLAVFADSDLLLEHGAQATTALDVVRKTEGYAVCYDTIYYISEADSQKIRAGETPTRKMAYHKFSKTWIGMFAIHRKLWDTLGGFNEKFKTWGGEDINFVHRLDLLGAPKNRVSGGVFHLKHPLAPGAK
jgi:hypothetical protein